MKYFNLFDQGKIPAIGLGTWQSDPKILQDAAQFAIEAGYRHLDCAAIYQNESTIGAALQQALATGGVSREQLWITSKLWNSYHRPEDVVPACKATLKDLNLDYLDLYLIHWPIAFAPRVGLGMPNTVDDFLTLDQAPISATWHAMEQLVSAGLVRYIGVSNFSQTKLEKLLPQATIQPAVNQIENHPLLAQPELVNYCKQNGIVVTAYAPLGSGGRAAEFKHSDEPSLLDSPVIGAIASAHNRSAAQILLAWQLQRGVVAIPKSTNKARIAENLAALDIQLSAAEKAQIDQLDRDYRYFDGVFWQSQDAPYTTATVFD